MTREVHDIPPAPRQVRWRAVLWHWWPLAFLGFVLAVHGASRLVMASDFAPVNSQTPVAQGAQRTA